MNPTILLVMSGSNIVPTRATLATECESVFRLQNPDETQVRIRHGRPVKGKWRQIRQRLILEFQAAGSIHVPIPSTGSNIARGCDVWMGRKQSLR
jgi:hypothetical protein